MGATGIFWAELGEKRDEIDRLNAKLKKQEAIIAAAVRAKRTLKECSRITAGGSDEEVEALVEAVEAYEKE